MGAHSFSEGGARHHAWPLPCLQAGVLGKEGWALCNPQLAEALPLACPLLLLLQLPQPPVCTVP